MSFSTRLILSMVLMLALLTTVVAGLFLFLNNLSDAERRIVDKLVIETKTAQDLEIQVAVPIEEIEHYSLTGRPEYRRRFLASVKETDELFKKALGHKFQSRGHKEPVFLALEKWRKAKRLSGAIINAPSPVQEQENAKKALEAMTSIREAQALLSTAADQGFKEAAEGTAKAEAALKRVRSFIVLTVGIGVLAVVFISIFLVRSFLKPLSELEKGVNRISGGDLSHKIDVGSRKHEISQVATAFNKMAADIRLYRQQLTDLATHDALTGLFNRREFLRRLDEEISLAVRYDQQFYLVMMDIDNFKAINDRYGHPVGDRVLAKLAEHVTTIIRPNDVFARYGGEEYMIILPRCDSGRAMVFAERVRTFIAAQTIEADGGRTFNFTVSLGIAGFPKDARDADSIINKTDQALYHSKRSGRNQSSFYTEAA